MNWFRTSEQAAEYEYLDWSQKVESSKQPQPKKKFDGLVHYSYS